MTIIISFTLGIIGGAMLGWYAGRGYLRYQAERMMLSMLANAQAILQSMESNQKPKTND
jgi:hypothetical protein